MQHTFKPEAGSFFNMMANADGYVAIGSDGYIVDASSVIPGGFTVSHLDNETGLYTITSDQAFNKIFASITFHANDAAALFPQIAEPSDPTTQVVVRLVNGSGSATNPSADCGFSFLLRCKVSGVPN